MPPFEQKRLVGLMHKNIRYHRERHDTMGLSLSNLHRIKQRMKPNRALTDGSVIGS